MQHIGQATDVEGIRQRMARFRSAASHQRALDFRPRADDVFVSTYPKSGTTLMQQIVHGLRTGGDMDFAEITLVVPWLEMAHDMGIDPYAEQRAWPRAFKTHLSGHDVPRGARYIHILRDPRDVAVSFYHFLDGWVMAPGAISLDRFVLDYLLAGTRNGTYWDHLLSWWPQRQRPDTLMLCYEDVVADLPGTVDRVAGFMGLSADAERLEIATRQAHIDFMKAHESQFDDHPLRDLRNPVIGLPAGAANTKVRSGKVGGHRDVLSDEVLAKLDERWRERVATATGCADYPALRRVLRTASAPRG